MQRFSFYRRFTLFSLLCKFLSCADWHFIRIGMDKELPPPFSASKARNKRGPDIKKAPGVNVSIQVMGFQHKYRHKDSIKIKSRIRIGQSNFADPGYFSLYKTTFQKVNHQKKRTRLELFSVFCDCFLSELKHP